MSFNFGSATTTAASTFGTATPSTGFAFGSGDTAKQGLFGTGGNNAENKPAFNFTSPSGGGFAFGAAKTTAAPTSSLFSTPTTSAGASPAFGAAKTPVNFGGFTSPPNQTVGSPGFGQIQGGAGSLGGGNTQQPAPAFGTPTTQASTGFGASPSGFGFGQSNPPASSAFGQAQPATTGFGQPAQQPTVGFGTQPATSGFGFSTPASGFSAPQASTAATTSAAAPTQSFLSSPGAPSGFAQTAFGAKPGSAFSFGGGNAAAPPAFSSAPAPTSTAGAFGQKPAGLSFGTIGGTTNTTTGQATDLTGQTTGLTAQSTGLSFGTAQATATSAPAFGTLTSSFQTSQAQPGQMGSLGTSFGGGQQAPLSFGTSQPSLQPQSGLSFAPTSTATSQPGLSFGATTTSQPGQLSFGATLSQAPTSTAGAIGTSTANQKPLTLGQASPAGQFPKTSAAPISFAPVASTPGSSAASTTPAASTGLAAWSTPLATTTQPTAGLSFGTSTAASTGLSFGVSTAASTIQSGFSLGTSANKSVLGFGKSITSVAASSAASTTAPSGITALGKTTATTTMASLTTATTTTAAAPPQAITSISFAQLEENINKWTLELEEQEKTFINQATQINAWDRLLIANGEKIVELNDAVQSVKNEQQSLEHELDFVLAQQKELEDLLAPMEKQLSEETVDRLRDPEREHMYSLAENLDTQLRQMSEDLKEVIEHLNETNRSQDSNDPIVQIGRILNAHMSSMQWIDNSIAQISTKLDQLKATHDTLRRDNERSYQLTYN
ncbi:hypothetical protein PYW07_010530 [Mythimna separata]|uniref:Nucleoporin NSP1-like C-terminal domain-containing protein n=1 Tax=Mythimna separata TaxID=271217 RepID=A0AAD8DMD3_MYTSE|nr:hypothetical protein PYW07_010530 [Mythimna separata]